MGIIGGGVNARMWCTESKSDKLCREAKDEVISDINGVACNNSGGGGDSVETTLRGCIVDIDGDTIVGKSGLADLVSLKSTWREI